MALRDEIEHPGEGAEVEFRLMKPADLNAVLRLEQLSFSDPWTLESFEAEIADSPYVRWPLVAIWDDSLIGYVVAWFVADEAHIANLAVDPRWRRRGIGRLLMERTIAEGRRRGARWMHLEVRPSNDAANALYRRLGFKPAGRRRRYYTDTGEDAVIMTRRIDDDPAASDRAARSSSGG